MKTRNPKMYRMCGQHINASDDKCTDLGRHAWTEYDYEQQHKTKPQHTPTPCEACEVGVCLEDHASQWEVHEGQDYIHIYGDGHDDSSDPLATVVNVKTAKRIVRAVNLHEELIQMIKTLREAFYVKGTSKDVREAFMSINDRFKEIAKAEGK